jgi:hypothetical protein
MSVWFDAPPASKAAAGGGYGGHLACAKIESATSGQPFGGAVTVSNVLLNGTCQEVEIRVPSSIPPGLYQVTLHEATTKTERSYVLPFGVPSRAPGPAFAELDHWGNRSVPRADRPRRPARDRVAPTSRRGRLRLHPRPDEGHDHQPNGGWPGTSVRPARPRPDAMTATRRAGTAAGRVSGGPRRSAPRRCPGARRGRWRRRT